MKVGEKLELDVQRLVWRGRALSRISSGKVVIIDPGVFPGERVVVRISKSKKDHLEANWTDILEPVPERRIHPCSYSRFCGGCRFGVLPQTRQLELKKDLLQNEIRRALGGKYSPGGLQKVYPGKPGWRYRWRGQVHVKGHKPHLKRFQSQELVPCEDCLLFSRKLGDNLREICKDLPDGRHTLAASPLENRVLSAEILSGGTREILSGGTREILSGGTRNSRKKIVLPLGYREIEIRIPPKTFFQAHLKLNRDLIAFVESSLEGYESVADFFAGAGNFALPLAMLGKRVLAVEQDADALDAIERTSKDLGLCNLTSRRCDLQKKEAIEALESFSPRAAILDPPRQGGKNNLLSLNKAKYLKRLVWVSCDVVNTCRDIGEFLNRGWRITDLALFDMFPQTWHMEVVIVLDR